MSNTPIILVPGFWLGAWAWDEVADTAARRRPRRHRADAARSRVGRCRPFVDHARRSRRGDLRRGPGGGSTRSCSPCTVAPACPATPRPTACPSLIAHMVYVDTGPATAAMDPDFEGDEYPLPSPGGARREREPRRAQRGAARHVPQPGRARTGRRAARCARAHERRAARRAEHGHRHRRTPRRSTSDAAAEGQPWLGGLNDLRKSPGSTCRRATGRCGPGRRSSPTSSAASRVTGDHPSSSTSRRSPRLRRDAEHPSP